MNRYIQSLEIHNDYAFKILPHIQSRFSMTSSPALRTPHSCTSSLRSISVTTCALHQLPHRPSPPPALQLLYVVLCRGHYNTCFRRFWFFFSGAAANASSVTDLSRSTYRPQPYGGKCPPRPAPPRLLLDLDIISSAVVFCRCWCRWQRMYLTGSCTQRCLTVKSSVL